ncbi:caspase recruitment domain-containing protein [Ditylenchus destructor]|nr:caspase recruitment domain-containing protein [Ditylenchus destructor]
MSTSTTSSTSASPAELRQQMQSVSLEHLRNRLANVDLRDLVPFLVARHVLRSHEMGAVYSKPGQVDQLNEFIEILKTKNHWMGPVIDCLIRNGQTAIAEELMRQKT